MTKAWLRFQDWAERRHVTFFLAAMAAVALVTLFGPHGTGVSVEFTHVEQDRIEVASTHETQLPPLVFDVAEWDAFVKGAEAGEFDV